MRSGRRRHDIGSRQQRRREGVFFLVLFALTIPAANWLIGHVGTACIAPHGPCVVPVAPGLMAPSGVMMVGVALVLRDLVQRRLGTAMSALAILAARPVGAVGAAVARSCVRRRVSAFGIRRSCAFIRRSRAAAWLPPSSLRASSGWSSTSIVFLWLAFGSLDFLPGQVVGKAWMVLLSIPFVAWLRRRDERLGITPA